MPQDVLDQDFAAQIEAEYQKRQKQKTFAERIEGEYQKRQLAKKYDDPFGRHAPESSPEPFGAFFKDPFAVEQGEQGAPNAIAATAPEYTPAEQRQRAREFERSVPREADWRDLRGSLKEGDMFVNTDGDIVKRGRPLLLGEAEGISQQLKGERAGTGLWSDPTRFSTPQERVPLDYEGSPPPVRASDEIGFPVEPPASPTHEVDRVISDEELQSLAPGVDPKAIRGGFVDASPETISKTRDLLTNIMNRGKTRRILEDSTPEEIAEIQRIAPGFAREVMGVERGGFLDRALHGFWKGGVSKAHSFFELIGVGGTKEEIAEIRKLQAAASEFDPQKKGDPWWERALIGATEQFVPMADFVGMGKFGGATAKALNLTSKGAVTTGTTLGITMAGAPQNIIAEKEALEAAGLSKSEALVWGTLLGGWISSLEAIVPNPWKGGKVPLTQGWWKAARSAAYETAKRFPAELVLEEGGQALSSELGRMFLTQHPEIPENLAVPAIEETIQQVKDAFLPLAVLMGLPGSVRTGFAAGKARSFDKTLPPWVRSARKYVEEFGAEAPSRSKRMDLFKQMVEKGEALARAVAEEAETIRRASSQTTVAPPPATDMQTVSSGEFGLGQPVPEGTLPPVEPTATQETPPSDIDKSVDIALSTRATDEESSGLDLDILELEIDRFEALHKKGKLSPDSLNGTHLAEGLYTAERMGLNRAIETNPDAFIARLRTNLSERRARSDTTQETPAPVSAQETPVVPIEQELDEAEQADVQSELEAEGAVERPEPIEQPVKSLGKKRRSWQSDLKDRAKELRKSRGEKPVESVEPTVVQDVEIELDDEAGTASPPPMTKVGKGGDIETALVAAELQGYNIKPRKPATKDEQEIVDFMEARGKKFSFVDGDDYVGGLASKDGWIFINSKVLGDSVDQLWNVLGHELSHETGLDKTIPVGSKELEAAKQEYLSRVKDEAHRKQLEKPGVLDREGRAMIIGKFLEDKAFRDKLRRDNPTMWEQIKELVLKAIGKWTPTNEAHKQVLEELRQTKPPSKGKKPAAPKKSKGPKAVESWQMTRDDVFKANPHRDELSYIDNNREQGIALDKHKEAVKQAIAAGKPVPANVLADYPELQPKKSTGKKAPVEKEKKPETPDYSSMTVAQLKDEAKKAGLKGYSGKKKDYLIGMLENQNEAFVIEKHKKPAKADKPKTKAAIKKDRGKEERRYWRHLRKRAPNAKKSEEGMVEVNVRGNKVEVFSKILDDTWAITTGVVDIDGKPTPVSQAHLTDEQWKEHKDKQWNLTHRPTGLSFATAKQVDLRDLYQMVVDTGLEIPASQKDFSSELQATMNALNKAWDEGDLSLLKPELRKQFLDAVVVPDPGVEADHIVDSDDLENKPKTIRMIKALLKEVPGFSANPVFEYDGKSLKFATDKAIFDFNADVFIDEALLTSGETVGINVPDLGSKLAEVDEDAPMLMPISKAAKKLKKKGKKFSTEREFTDEFHAAMKAVGGRAQSAGGSEIAPMLLPAQPERITWFKKSRKLVEDKMGGKATPQQVMAMLKKNGVKQEELDWNGLTELLGDTKSGKKITKEQVLQAIDTGLQIEEVVKGGVQTEDEMRATEQEGGNPNTKFASYTLPGGKNYQEVLLTLPSAQQSLGKPTTAKIGDAGWEVYDENGKPYGVYSADSEQTALTRAEQIGPTNFGIDEAKRKDYTGGHFDEPNVVVHLRLNERVDAGGKKVLFIEEVQSDWHQEGRKKGYLDPKTIPNYGKWTATQTGVKGRGPISGQMEYDVKDESGRSYFSTFAFDEKEAITKAVRSHKEHHGGGAKQLVPDAPFKKTWPMLGMKRAMMLAVEKGMDKIAWTTGEQQADRYDLSKQVDSIDWVSRGDRKLVTIDMRDAMNGEIGLIELTVEDGKVLRVSTDDAAQFEGKPLEDVVGKEIAEQILNGESGELKGEGLKVGGEGMKSFYDKMLPNEVNKFVKKFGAKVGTTEIETEKGYIEGVPARYPDTVEVPALDITPSMRDSIKREGLPMLMPADRPSRRESFRKPKPIGERRIQFGRPDLANPAIDEEARRLVDDVDEARNQRGLPERRADEDVEQEANERLARDYKGEREKLVQAGRTGGQLKDTDTIIAKKIINREASEAMRSGDTRKVSEAMAIIESYRNTGSEQARGLRQRRDPVETPAERMARAISEAILEPPRKQRERRNAARREGNHHIADRINEDWAKKFQDLKDKLKVLGVDLDNLWEDGYSRTKAGRILSTIQHAKADAWDKAFEYWRNSILSLPTTQMANLIGNVGHAGYHFTAERLTEALVNTITRRGESAQLGEFKHMLAGMLPGMSEGARNFITSWNTETPVFEASIDREGQWRIEDPNTAIGGKKGRIIRWPQRLLLAVDDFSKTLFTRMEVGANAYRVAKSEGLTGEALANRMQELTLDTESAVWDSAYDSALELTFQQKGGQTLRHAKQHALAVRRDLPGIRYLLPFITTPANIFATGIRKSPLGSALIPLKMYRNYKAGRHVLYGLPSNVAEQVLAWGLVLALLGNDEEDPFITGTEAESEYAKRQVGYRTEGGPQSIKLFGRWYSYSRLEPFATVLGLTVDFVNALRSGNTARQVNVPLTSLRGQIGSKTFLRGIGDILDAVQEPTPSEGIAKWASGFATSWVPNVVRGTGREASDFYENRRVWGTGAEWYKRLGKRTLQKTELAWFQEYPIYDVWGRPATRSQTGAGRLTDWLYRITVPIKIQSAETFSADRLILNYNLQNAEDERFPLSPLPYYRRDGKTHYMTDDQYAELSRLAGETAKAALDEIKFDVDNPTLEAVELINKLAADARTEVRSRLIDRWNGKKIELDQESLGREIFLKNKLNVLVAGAKSPPDKSNYKNRPEAFEAATKKYDETKQERKDQLKLLFPTQDDALKLLREEYDYRRKNPPRMTNETYTKRKKSLEKLYSD